MLEKASVSSGEQLRDEVRAHQLNPALGSVATRQTETLLVSAANLDPYDEDELSSLDIIERLQLSGMDSASLAYVNQTMGTRPVSLEAVVKAEWAIMALPRERFAEFKMGLPNLRETVAQILADGGIPAQWLRFGHGAKDTHQLLIGKAARRALAAGYSGDWVEVKPRQRQRSSKSSNTKVNVSGLEADAVGLFMKDMGQYKLLTKEDEIMLAGRIAAGKAAALKLQSDDKITNRERVSWRRAVSEGSDAKQQFVNANLRLVLSIAKRYLGTGMDLADLIQEGTFGLMQAVDKFDADKGFKFSTYGTWWIRQSIQRAVGNSGRIIRLPLEVQAQQLRLQKVKEQLVAKFGREPSLEEIAMADDKTVKEIVDLYSYSDADLYLNEPLNAESDREHGDMIADPVTSGVLEDVASNVDYKQAVEHLFTFLNETEIDVVRLHYMDQMTLKEVAKELHISESKVVRTLARTRKKLREQSVSDRVAL